LEWQVEETGTVMLYDLIIPILVLSVLLLVTVAYVIWRALNAAKRVQNYHDWLEFQAEDLREARNQAEAANRSKSHFLATMSHELRTPLNAIIGFSDLIRNVPGVPSQPEKVVEYVTDIHSSGQYLLALINDILDMSKIESKRFELYEEVARPDVLIDECTKLVRPDADAKSIAIRRTRKSFFLLCDERAVRQILINLLSNAIKFSPPNSLIQIAISHNTGEDFTISIIDQGIGMSAEEIERAMLPFGQIRDAHVRENQGTGLGLNISRALTELHGGSLTLESRPGKGTKASIRFPDHRVVQNPSA
ncbi:MAG: ATP-binding protein, partial [Alphaproteobacteria bacterium]|nr:ATP-binding protein [Alphaproteobacteria bacterium]